jgi:hypothetical protein
MSGSLLGRLVQRIAGVRTPTIDWQGDRVRYKCASCDAWHVGVPSWHVPAPDSVMEMTPAEVATRVWREDDYLIVDRQHFCTLALLELPIQGMTETHAWGVWVNLSKADAKTFLRLYNDPSRAAGITFEGVLTNALPGYPTTRKLPVRLITRAYPTRPYVEIVDVDHPLAVDQRVGLTIAALREQITPLFAPGDVAPGPTDPTVM